MSKAKLHGERKNFASRLLAIKVIWLDGTEEYLKEGQRTASFSGDGLARAMRDFMLEGMSDEVQSINVVPYPSPNEASA